MEQFCGDSGELVHSFSVRNIQHCRQLIYQVTSTKIKVAFQNVNYSTLNF